MFLLLLSSTVSVAKSRTSIIFVFVKWKPTPHEWDVLKPETTGTKPPERNHWNETTGPKRPEQESEMTKIEHDRNNVVEHDRNDSET